MEEGFQEVVGRKREWRKVMERMGEGYGAEVWGSELIDLF